MLHFEFTPIDMSSIYKQEYDLGWITKDNVKGYVQMGFVTPEQYQVIVGEEYVS